MKVKVLKRNVEDFVRETKHDIHKIHRNYNQSEHPFEAEREYQRALNSVKLDKIFAKPFIGSLDGHRDSISCVAKHPDAVSSIVSASADGEVRLWCLSERKCTSTWPAHSGFIRGLTYTPAGAQVLSCGDDKTIKTWNVESPSDTPVDTIVCKNMVTGISHERKGDRFATCGEATQLWATGRSVPIRTFQWGVDTVHCLKFNQVETNVLAAAADDNSIIIYDTREVGAVRKVVMTLRSNALAWNPMEAFVFTTASEDYNLYSYDMRKLGRPINVHMDHVSAVVDIDYSPTGKEFVSGSYDKTIRLFRAMEGRSREIYHTKRMQRLTNVLWSNDDRYIVSGSDEMCLRLWKARASEKLGVIKDRERVSLQYKEKLKEKYAHHPQISRISRHKQVPKHVKNAAKEHATIRQKKKRKEANVNKFSKDPQFTDERQKAVVEES
eukprot:TRINITY_DN13462_c0_g1_i1.p1 TRINITY_DN13462_c0_g1~~TRINITY_DN13462_c0_g1_i1.p1  ORF type:complete len:439 (-),score=75.40 TRINITY_DN13462_c0_g1_i1:547-1863(-)